METVSKTITVSNSYLNKKDFFGFTPARTKRNIEQIQHNDLSSKVQSLVSYEVTNIKNQSQANQLTRLIIQKLETINTLINKAGIVQHFINAIKMEYNAVDKMMNINFIGTLYMSKSFLPYLIKRLEANLTDIIKEGSFTHFPNQTIYSKVLFLQRPIFQKGNFA